MPKLLIQAGQKDSQGRHSEHEENQHTETHRGTDREKWTEQERYDLLPHPPYVMAQTTDKVVNSATDAAACRSHLVHL
jgi:hypothetical protein